MNTFAAILLIAAAGLAGGFVLGRVTGQDEPPPPSPMVQQGVGEITDLFQRLRPLVKNPDGEWYNSGIEVTFYGAGVKITLKQPNGNEYHGQAHTLTEAVARITQPSAQIQSALKGWGGTQDGHDGL
jgi:hypothetical protein